MTMLVYRIENEHGFGPYYHRPLNARLQDELLGHNGDSMRPGPDRDHLRKGMELLLEKARGERIYFGFESLEQLKRWFIGWVRDALLKEGYRIKAYIVAVADTASTRYQTIFANGKLDHVYI